MTQLRDDLLGIYRGKRVLVTGHTGFKGSWLSLWLRELGAEVTGYALPPPTVPALFELLDIAGQIRHHVGDVRDLRELRERVAKAEPELVFHLAAQALVRESIREPVDTFATNVMGTVNLLEVVRSLPSVRAVVIVTSDKCYRDQAAPHGHRESDPLGGADPYSASKAASELVVEAYRSTFFAGREPGIGIASARAGNVIGGGDWGIDRLVPDCVRALGAGEPVRLRFPDSVRPWQHVLDGLCGYLILGERLLADPAGYSEAWNFGPTEPTDITAQELAERFLASWGGGRVERDVRADAPAERHSLRLDPTKAQERLGWRPTLSTEEALEWTTRWYQVWRHSPDGVSAESIEQLRRFSQRVSFG